MDTLPMLAMGVLAGILIVAGIAIVLAKRRGETNVTTFLAIALILVLSAGLSTYAFQYQDAQDEIKMGLLVVAAIVTLMTILFTLAAGFQAMTLADKTKALGLPEGSIRAMIALVLIMVFILFGIYLYRNVAQGSAPLFLGRMSPRPDTASFLPTHVVMEKVQGDTVKVWAFQPISDEGKRLAQQLITTVGTLVVAVSGFYFGSNIATGAQPTPAQTPSDELTGAAKMQALRQLDDLEPQQPPLT